MKLKASTFASLACLLALTSCGKKEATEDKAVELPRVTVDVAHRLSVAQQKEYTATVEAENINNIAPSTPNRIKTIRVDVGDRVRAGQELVTLDRSNSDQLRINRDNLQREYDRAVKLLEIGSGTQQQVDQLQAQLDAVKSQYNNMMENTILRSPISGVVTARNYDPGDMTGNLPVLTVGQLSPVVKVMINITENDMSKIAAGMPVSVKFDAFGDEVFSGKVSRIHPTVDTATRTFQVEVQVANPKEEIKPGMFARVDINLGDQDNVVVPDRAVVKQTGSGNKYIYVLKGNKVSFQRVELGQRLDTSYELISGIEDGDTVVITGQARLTDGAEVEVQK